MFVLILGATGQAHAAQSAPASMSGDDFVRRVGSEGIDAQGLVITGDVDLGDVRRVDHLLACRDCTITGSLQAADVTFGRVVDLSGLHVHGSLDVHGARFLDAFLLQRSADRAPYVAGRTNLQVVTFEHQTAFDGVEFGGPFDCHRRGQVHVLDGGCRVRSE